MTTATQIAKSIRDVHFGGNWTSVNLKDTLAGLTWQQATAQVYSFNTIAVLVFHINYFVDVTLKVLQGHQLDAHDRFSFTHPPINSQQDWDNMLNKTWADAETFATLIERLPDSKLWEDFTDPKYGTYYSNLQGIAEHTHYHLGQIVLIKRMVQEVVAKG